MAGNAPMSAAPIERDDFSDLQGRVGAVVGRRIEHRRSVASTMDLAHRLAAEGAAEGVVVVADHQVSGRGRGARRVWRDSDGDDLATSVILRPAAAVAERLFIIAALAVADAVAPFVSDEISFKWPNDVLARRRKIAGVMVETSQRGAQLASVVGIGLNVNMRASHPAAREYRAVSLSVLNGGAQISRRAVLANLLSALDGYYAKARDGADDLVVRWAERLIDIGRRTQVKRGGAIEFEGVASGVDGSGRLIIRNADGREFKATADEVQIVRDP